MNLEMPARFKMEDLERLLNERFRRIGAAFDSVPAVVPSSGGGTGSGSGSGGGGAVLSVQLAEILPVSLANGPGVTTVSSTTNASSGALLAVEIQQGPAGWMQIAWSAQFAAGTGVDISMGANEITRKLFLGRADGLWHEWTTMGA